MNEWTETFMLFEVLSYVNSIEKQAGIKNIGLKIPVKDQIYILVEFSYYLRVQITGKGFSILCLIKF